MPSANTSAKSESTFHSSLRDALFGWSTISFLSWLENGSPKQAHFTFQPHARPFPILIDKDVGTSLIATDCCTAAPGTPGHKRTYNAVD